MKEFLGYIITDTGYNDSHIYKCYNILDNYSLKFIKRKYETVSDHIKIVPNEIYDQVLIPFSENELRLTAAKLENASKLGKGKGVCSHCIMTLYSNNG